VGASALQAGAFALSCTASCHHDGGCSGCSH
jgi:hypothetical protein